MPWEQQSQQGAYKAALTPSIIFTDTYNQETIKNLVSPWLGSSPLQSTRSQEFSNEANLDVVTGTWSGTIKLKSVGRATIKGDRLEAVQIDFGNGTQGSVLVGDAGNDILWGRAGWDIIDGAEGDDDIHGGNGRDVLTGGSGRDQLHGDFGWNTYTSSKDGARDLIAIKSDHLLYNWLLNSSGNNADGSKCDILEGLDPIDLIKVIGATTADLSFKADAVAHGVTGIGIYAKGALEALYTGGDLSLTQIVQMTSGDLTAPAGGSYSSW